MKTFHTIVLALLTAATPALADTHDSTPKLSSDDAAIVAHEHAVDQFEITVGTVAKKMGSTKDIQDLGKELIADHKKADGDLTKFAKEHDAVIGKDVPMTDADRRATAADEAALVKLETLKGAAFDQQFLAMMVAGHEREIAKVDAFANQTTDPDLKVMLTGIRPIMQTHLDKAEALQQSTPRT
jgi:putative membrane protein